MKFWSRVLWNKDIGSVLTKLQLNNDKQQLLTISIKLVVYLCVDGLTGFPQAIEAVFPKTEIQQYIIHQIRNTTKFVSYKDIKPLMVDLKRVYAAPTEDIAISELGLFDDKWGGKYPKIAKSWRDNWANLSTYFKYPEAVRRIIYTTNAIEGFNRQLGKVTKSKTVFPTDDSLLKMLYLATVSFYGLNYTLMIYSLFIIFFIPPWLSNILWFSFNLRFSIKST